MAPELIRFFDGFPDGRSDGLGCDFLLFSFGPGRLVGHTARRRRLTQHPWCHLIVGHRRKHAIERRVAGVLQLAPQRAGGVLGPFLFDPITDDGVGRARIFALACSYVREQEAHPFVSPSSRRTRWATRWEKD